MKRIVTLISLLITAFFSSIPFYSVSQTCVTLGQTPATAFPVCGTTTFNQSIVPTCATNDIYVPGCAGTGSGGAQYQNKNPFFYKFTCYASGTLSFLITPLANDEDYDWQLWDVTGQNPNAIFANNNSLVVSGNWAGTYGPTGASSTGVTFIQCASIPTDNAPTFARSPNLIVGHEYILMVSHFTDSQSGYGLSFAGGTAVITNPQEPHLQTAKTDCDGTKITVKLNKHMQCKSMTREGNEFSILPAVSPIVSVIQDSCSSAFDFDEITITFASVLPNGTYQLVINNGADGNTLLDNCGLLIPQGERIPFTYAAPQPIFADSIGKVKCAPDSVKIYFPKKISCASIAANGSDFAVTGPTPVAVTSAAGNCVNDKTDYVVVKFASPVYTQGTYQLALKPGTDGTILVDECGLQTPVQTLPFNTVDTVSALFQYTGRYGCREDTLTFLHNGAHGVNSWNWTFNNNITSTLQSPVIIFPASSTNTIQLSVSNGVCSDTASGTVILGNEVKAAFTMESITCPEDAITVTNTSTGDISSWFWKYDILSTSTMKDPPPFLFPNTGREAYYSVKLVVYNAVLNCNDSTTRTLTVLDHCFIGVPTAFTPNNDGRNDFFRPHNALKADNYTFQVYNRWGQRVFYSRNWQEKWDGKINGVAQGTGVFVWTLSYTNRDTGKPVFQKGTVTLIR